MDVSIFFLFASLPLLVVTDVMSRKKKKGSERRGKRKSKVCRVEVGCTGLKKIVRAVLKETKIVRTGVWSQSLFSHGLGVHMRVM